MMRAVASVPPPAPQGTMSCTGRCGYWANTEVAAHSSAASKTFRMTPPQVVRQALYHGRLEFWLPGGTHERTQPRPGSPPFPSKTRSCSARSATSTANGSAARQTIPVRNPATGAVLGTVPRLGAEETRRAIDAAERAWPAWRAKTAKERSVILRKWFDLMMANQDDLAQILTAEQGKPLAGSARRDRLRRLVHRVVRRGRPSASTAT